MLERAREGRYNQLEVNRGLPAPYMVKYFQKQGSVWQVSDDVRSMIEFRELNLIEPWTGISNMDIVLLRNVLIYFDLDTKRRILGQVRRNFRPDGCLSLGVAESTM